MRRDSSHGQGQGHAGSHSLDMIAVGRRLSLLIAVR